MTLKEKLIECAIALCRANGGEDAVALKCGISAENLRQITRRRKLKSGEPRGVGPSLQKTFDTFYPGRSAAALRTEPTATTTGIEGAVGLLSSALVTKRKATRAAAGSLLMSLADDPGDWQSIAAQLKALIEAAA